MKGADITTRPAASAAGRFDVSACALSDRGCVRSVNEDSGLVVRPAQEDQRARKGVLLVVADGMGGHMAGDLASRMAVDLVSRAYFDSPHPPAAALPQALHAANDGIYRHARLHAECHGMGTTCSALALVGDTAVTAHVGDSRIYLVRDGAMYGLTADDSAVGDLVRRGLLTPEQARHHADRHVVLSAIGTRADLRVSHRAPPLPVQADDRFLLCSDGLHDVLEDDEMRAAMVGQTPETACRALIALVLERGAPDNVTALVAHVTVTPVGAQVAAAGATATRPVPPTREAPTIEGASR